MPSVKDNKLNVNLRMAGPSQVVTHREGEAKTVLVPTLSEKGQNITVIGVFAGEVIRHPLTLHRLSITIL
jgi:hypothetical protein